MLKRRVVCPPKLQFFRDALCTGKSCARLRECWWVGRSVVMGSEYGRTRWFLCGLVPEVSKDVQLVRRQGCGQWGNTG